MRIFTTSAIVCALLIGSAQTSIGQDKVSDDKIMIEVPAETPKAALKKAEISSWYNFISASTDFGVSYTRITNATLFPDTAVFQLYGATGGGTQLGKTSTHSIGQVFDPKDSYVFFDDPKNITRFNPYTFDSVAILYRYAHNIPGTVDTVVIQFYNDDKIQKTSLSTDKRITATVAYDKAKNLGKATSEIRVLLDETSVTDWETNTDFKNIVVAVPDGMNVKEDGLVAVTISFIPGYAYSEGDTIEHDWEGGAPDKKLNHLIVGRYHDNAQLLKDFQSYNTGLMASRASRYTSQTWNNRYIPGAAWNEYDQQYYFQFHISATKISVPELGNDVVMYPNPAVNTPTIIEGDLLGTSMRIVDMTGREIQGPIELTNYNEINVEVGTYILVFEKDGMTYSKKLIKY